MLISISSERTRLLRRLLALSAAGAALFPSAARADGASPAVGAGLFVGASFEGDVAVEWGLELFATFPLKTVPQCSSQPRAGLGPLFQFSFVGSKESRVTLALQGGSEISRGGAAGSSVTGALGASYRFSDDPGFGIHSAVSYEWAFFNASLRHQWFLNETSLVGGARFWPTYGDNISICAVGRPLRTDRGFARIEERARTIDGERPRDQACDETAERAGRAWERDAQYECASVPAFLKLAADLLAHGAPDALVESALAAAKDEMRHAALCANVASRYLGARIWPALPELEDGAHFASDRHADLLRLAAESWLDGCLSEGAAAVRALRASRVAADPRVRRVQARIAVDEARHAEIGWSILQWAIDRGGDDVIDWVRTLRDVETTTSDNVVESIERYGQLGAAEIAEISERHAAHCRRRLAKWAANR